MSLTGNKIRIKVYKSDTVCHSLLPASHRPLSAFIKLLLTCLSRRLTYNSLLPACHSRQPTSASLLPTSVRLLPACPNLQPTFVSPQPANLNLQPTCFSLLLTSVSLQPTCLSLRSLLSPAGNLSTNVRKIFTHHFKISSNDDEISLVPDNTLSNEHKYHRKDTQSLISTNKESYTEGLSLMKTLSFLSMSVLYLRWHNLFRLMKAKNLPFFNLPKNIGGKPATCNP